MQRLILVLTILAFTLSCSSYRVQYYELFYIDDAETVHGPYEYEYEETFSHGWYQWACAFTFIWYGGACWLLSYPHKEDELALMKRARDKLDTLLGPYDLLEGNYQIAGVGQGKASIPPRLRINNSDWTIIARGEAAKINSMSPKHWFTAEKELGEDKTDEYFDDGGYNEPEPDSKYSYSALQLSLLNGTAEVRSTVSENGRSYTVAAGQVKHKVYELRTRSLPVSGVYWSFSPVYTRHSLNISDFDSGPILQSSFSSEDVPVVISNPSDQTVIDRYTNSYDVSIQNAGVLVGVGFGQHFKREGQPNFWSVDGGVWVGAVNYFQNDVSYQSRDVKNSYFDFLSGGRVDLNAFLNLTAYRLALGLHFQYAYYPKVKMPDDMEFRGVYSYQADKDVFERPRLFVDDLEYSSFLSGVSISYIFKEN